MTAANTGAGRIRRATRDDVPRIVALERAIFTDPWSARALAGALVRPEAVFLVFEREGTVAGYATGIQVVDEGEILNIAVDPGERRRGAGRELLAALLDSLVQRGARRLFLEVRASNAAAIALYEAFGFRRIGRRAAYYVRPVEDAVTMGTEIPLSGRQNDDRSHEIG